MLSRCANVQCSKPFLRLREGKLFLVETEGLSKAGGAAKPASVCARRSQCKVEHFWLCDECSVLYTLIYDRERGVVLAPLRRPAVTANASTAADRSGAA